jgi:asparagine synthase (glutamine-hydrolysing)
MSSATGKTQIVFNGEIYNYRELKAMLQSRGVEFYTTSDTEVIVNLYEEYGIEAFKQLNGIFAVALVDQQKQCMVLARDQFGVKPLYYWIGEGQLVFASEIKAILKDPSIPREVDREALSSYLTFRYNPSPQTLFKGIHKLPPGQYLRVTRKGAEEPILFSEQVPKTNTGITEREAIREYQTLFRAAVRRQLISDVPVGLFLSGGIDSAAIGYVMQQELNTPIQTFTIGFEGRGEFNELEDARSTAHLLGTHHHEMTISQKEYVDFFFKSFYHMEEPIAQTTIPALYYLAKLASQHLKVVLAGQGADEPLAGYQRYVGEKYLGTFGPFLRILPMRRLASFLPRHDRFSRLAYANQYLKEIERFLGIYTIFTPEQKQLLLLPEVRASTKDVDLHLLEKLYDRTSESTDSLTKMLFIDTRMTLSDNLLLFGDKVTMANSLEMRVPFLDVELIGFLESLPSSMKIRGRTTKYIHKKALEEWLPRELLMRKKRPFATPMSNWLQGGLADLAERVLNQPDSLSFMLFDLKYINRIIEEHRQRKANYNNHIFALFSLELWYQTFFLDRRIDPEMFAR